MLSTSNNLQSIEEWFGASTYRNAGGPVRVAFDNPFGTSILTNDITYIGGPSNAGVTSLLSNAEAIAYYESGRVFAFTHEYGAGRVYYQAQIRLLEQA